MQAQRLNPGLAVCADGLKSALDYYTEFDSPGPAAPIFWFVDANDREAATNIVAKHFPNSNVQVRPIHWLWDMWILAGPAGVVVSRF
jgi:hypothetical protein